MKPKPFATIVFPREKEKPYLWAKIHGWLYRKKYYDVQEAIDSLPNNPGGLVWVKEGTHSRADKITIDASKSLILEGAGIGTKLRNTSTDPILDVSTTGTPDWFAEMLCTVKNLTLDAEDQTKNGINITDRFSVLFKNIKILEPDVGILITDDTYWSESTIIKDAEIYNPKAAGIRFDKTTGTGSFVSSYLKRIWMHLNTENSIGLDITNGSQLASSIFDTFHFWSFVDNVKHIVLDGAVDYTDWLNIQLENQKGTPVGVVGIELGANMTGTPTFIPKPNIHGGFNTEIDNSNDKPYVCMGRQRYSVSSSAANLRTLDLTNEQDDKFVGFNLTGSGRQVIHVISNGRPAGDEIWSIQETTGWTKYHVLYAGGGVYHAGQMSLGGNLDLLDHEIIDPLNYVDATLSGTPKVVGVTIDGTPYYFKVYPTKS